MRQVSVVLIVVCGVSVFSERLVFAEEEAAEQLQAIQPEDPQLGRPVDFEKDVVPIFDQNCVACHNVGISESKLVVEDVESLLKGGKRGASVVPGKPDESLLYQLAARGKQPLMPPMPNQMDANPLTPKELGILRQWILEGATASGEGRMRQVTFHPIPAGRHAIFSVAVSPWGRYAASGRANQILLYDLATGEEIARLTDPALDGVEHEGRPMYPGGAAHRDFVQSLAFSPDGTLLASGGFRVVKLWKQTLASAKLPLEAGQPVTATAASRDGKLAAIATADNVIRLINLADNTPGPALSGHGGKVTGLEFSADGTRLFSSSLDQSIRIWNTADGAPAGRIDTPAAVNDLALNKEGTQVISAGADNLIRVWNVPAAAPAQLAATESPVLAAAVSADRKWLAVASEDGKVTLIDLAGGQPPRALNGHAGAVNAVAFSANNARLVTGGADQTVRVWDVASGNPLAALAGGTGAVSAVALHPNGNQVISGSADANAANVWKLDVPAPRPLAGENGNPVKVAAVSPDGKLLAVGATAEGKPVVLVRDIASGNVTHTLAGHEAAVTAVAFSADASKVVSGSEDKTARVWNLADGKELAKFAAHTAGVTGVAFNSNAQQVVSGSADNSLKLWNVADGAELKNFAGHGGAVTAVAMPNDQAVVSASADQTIRVWNPADGAQVRAIAHGQPVTALAVSRDGAKIAAAGTDQHVKIYNTGDGNLAATLSAHAAAAKSVSFAPDGTRLLTSADDKQAIVWDMAAARPLERLTFDKSITAAAYSGAADGVLVATDDQAIAYHTLHFERALAGHDKPITDLVYAPDGNFVFSSSEDGTIRRFQIANGQQQFAAGHGAPVHDLDLSPNGQLLASAGANNQVRIWNAGNGGNGPRPSLDGFDTPVKSVAFTGDNNRVVAGTASNQVRVYSLQSGAVEQLFTEHAGSVEALSIAGEQGDRVLSASADKTVRSWSVAAVSQIAGHGQPVTSVDLVL
ncbi:MAG TPA: c-type cytochrome domain-containing protein, partial [Planctomycetaceae bacterium]|nr:c-type cytochrome domain-containing protein [Planctomycetaceae bacterium]